MIGQTISHYTILEELGHGGMSVVYKALDTELDREVALKILPECPEGSEEDEARFIREARLASALNHPNICRVNGVGRDRGELFIDMELIDGTTLRKIVNEGRIPIEDALAYASQIANGLHEAHSSGILHRDIKPENVMIDRHDRVKVVDFGVAKLKGSLKLTRTGSTVGTLLYMAPETILGEEADERSDIFSLGVLFYEMLTGRPPFRGEHEAAIVYSVVNEEPEPLQHTLPGIPPALPEIIGKALQKKPEARYQSVLELLADLHQAVQDPESVSGAFLGRPSAGATSSRPEAAHPGNARGFLRLSVEGVVVLSATLLFLIHPWGPDAGTPEPKRLAVLTFENLGGEEHDYFVEGISDEIRNRLCRLAGLSVIARSSILEWEKTTRSVKEIGSELGVDYVLAGTVAWPAGSDDRVRISPELIDVKTMIQKWSTPLELSSSEVFAVQSTVSLEVARAIDLELLEPEEEVLMKFPTQNPQAYDFFLRGLEYEKLDYDAGAMASAETMFKRAIDADPDFAAAYVGLSLVNSSFYWSFDPSEERARTAHQAADKAIDLDPDFPDAYAAKGWAFYHGEFDYENALEQFDIALALEPDNVTTLYGIGSVRRRQGDMRGCVEAYKAGLANDPLFSLTIRDIGWTLSLDRRYEEADEYNDRTLTLAPNDHVALQQKVFNILKWTGDLGRARSVYHDIVENGGYPYEPWQLSYTKVVLSWFERDYQAARTAIADLPWEEPHRAILEASIEQTIGDRNNAVVHYRRAREILEATEPGKPKEHGLHSSLGIAYAGLGRDRDAVRHAEMAVEIMPYEKDAVRGQQALIGLAETYAMVGRDQQAIDVIERLLQLPSNLSVHFLRLDPTWDPLRHHPRFQEIVGFDHNE